MRKIKCEICPVRGQSVIRDLSAEAIRDFCDAGVSSIYRPRQVIFSEGSPTSGLYIVCAGAVKLYHSDRFGRDHILEVVGPGTVLGELSLDENNEMSVAAEALTQSQISYLPTPRLVDFVEKYPATGLRLIEALSRELASARRKARDLALKRAQSRMAGLLLDLVDVSGGMTSPDRVQLRYTRRELGEMIGVTTETAIRLLSKLRALGIITTEGRSIRIGDLGELKRIAHHDETNAQ